MWVVVVEAWLFAAVSSVFSHSVSSVSSTSSPLSGINKREADGCHFIHHMANSFVVETVICDQ